MSGFDFLILFIVGVAAVGGFMRGLVQEVLSLASWVLAAFSVHFLHPYLVQGLKTFYAGEPTTSLLAVALLLLIPYAAMKVIVGNASAASDGAILGPIDRVLGFGFGAVKGALIAVFGFTVLVMGFDDTWGYKGRPTWITTARTYAAADAFSRQLVPMIGVKRDQMRREIKAQEAAAAKAAS